MRIINDLRPVTVASDGAREIDGVVRVRGIDATAGDRGVRFERRVPVAIIVRDAGGVRRMTLPEQHTNALAFIAAPLAAFAISQAFRRRQKR